MSDETKQKIDDGGPAFPACDLYYKDEEEIIDSASQGMSTRTWLAGMAMQGILAANTLDEETFENVADFSVTIADATIAQLNKDTATSRHSPA